MISRRSFLHSTATTTMALPLLQASSTIQSEWIDAHVHVWTPDTQKYPLNEKFKKADMAPASFTPEELFAHCRPQGVARIVLIQMSFYLYDNQYMIDCMEKHKGVFSGVAIVDENRADVTKTMKSLAEKGVRGFRLYTDKEKASAWNDSKGMNSMWSYAADAGLSMCLLANPDALPIVQKMCEKYPKTRVVIDHFARIGMTGQVQSKELDDLCRLASFENVFVKTSAFYALGKKQAPYTDLGEMVRRLVKEYGSNRLMWASDCPFQVEKGHNYAESIALIRDRLEFLTDKDKSWMLKQTAEKVFFS